MMDVNFVEIETTNFCQNDCDFCRPGMTREIAWLDLDRFKDIIIELKLLGFEGHLVFAGLGEPFLHKNIMEMLQYSREHLLGTVIILYTNGRLFYQSHLFEQLHGIVDFMVYNNYSDEVGTRLSTAYRLAHVKPQLGCIDHAGGEYSFYNDRGGQPELSKYQRGIIDNPCHNFNRRLFLASEGYFVTCCQDMKHMRKWNKSIKAMLESEDYKTLAAQLGHSRGGVPLCNNCGVVMGTVYYPPPLPSRLNG